MRIDHIPICVNAFEARTADLSIHEEGVLVRLLFAYWQSASLSLPDPDTFLDPTQARMVEEFFRPEDNPPIKAMIDWRLHESHWPDGNWSQVRALTPEEWVARP